MSDCARRNVSYRINYIELVFTFCVPYISDKRQGWLDKMIYRNSSHNLLSTNLETPVTSTISAQLLGIKLVASRISKSSVGPEYPLSSSVVFEFQGRGRDPLLHPSNFFRASRTGGCRKVSSQIRFPTWQELFSLWPENLFVLSRWFYARVRERKREWLKIEVPRQPAKTDHWIIRDRNDEEKAQVFETVKNPADS